IAQGTCRNTVENHLFSSAASKGGAHFIKHLLGMNNQSFFGQIPSGTKRLSPGNYSYFDKRCRMFQHPAYGSMTCFVECNGTLFVDRHYFVLLFKTAYNS